MRWWKGSNLSSTWHYLNASLWWVSSVVFIPLVVLSMTCPFNNLCALLYPVCHSTFFFSPSSFPFILLFVLIFSILDGVITLLSQQVMLYDPCALSTKASGVTALCLVKCMMEKKAGKCDSAFSPEKYTCKDVAGILARSQMGQRQWEPHSLKEMPVKIIITGWQQVCPCSSPHLQVT